MNFIIKKVLYLWEICRGSNGNIQCKITRHFLKWSTKWKRRKATGGSVLWTGLMRVTFRVYYIKIVLRVNSGILHHSILKPEIGHQSSQLCYLSEQFWSFLKTEDNSIELVTPGSKPWTFPRRKGAGPHAHRTRRVARTRPLGESPSHPRGHFPPSLTLIKATLFVNEYLLRDQLCIGQSTVTGLKMKTKFTVKNTYVHGWHTQASP